MVVRLATVKIPSAPSLGFGLRTLEVAAALLFERVRRGWPVLTGRSRNGLDYYVRAIADQQIEMLITDRYAYARYVEERWYPLDRLLNDQSVRAALGDAGRVPEGDRSVAGKLSSPTDPSQSFSRPVTIRGAFERPFPAGQVPVSDGGSPAAPSSESLPPPPTIPAVDDIVPPPLVEPDLPDTGQLRDGTFIVDDQINRNLESDWEDILRKFYPDHNPGPFDPPIPDGVYNWSNGTRDPVIRDLIQESLDAAAQGRPAELTEAQREYVDGVIRDSKPIRLTGEAKLFRGMVIQDEEAKQKFLAAVGDPGDLFSLAAPQSFSFDEAVAGRYSTPRAGFEHLGEPLRVIIEAEGGEGRFALGAFGIEAEAVMAPGQQMRIKSTSQTGNELKVTVELVDVDPATSDPLPTVTEPPPERKPKAADVVFGEPRHINLTGLIRKLEREHGLEVGDGVENLSAEGRDALVTFLDYAAENYPDAFEQLARVEMVTGANDSDLGAIAAIGIDWEGSLRNRARGPSTLILSQRWFEGYQYELEVADRPIFEPWDDGTDYVYKPPPDPSEIGYDDAWSYAEYDHDRNVWVVNNVDSEYTDPDVPPPQFISPAETDQIREAEFDRALARVDRFAVGDDDRFGGRVTNKREKLRSVLIHEIGHMVHNSRGAVLDTRPHAINPLVAEWESWRDRSGGRRWEVWAQEISDYATTDMAEATAEAFTVRELYGAEHLPVEAREWLEYLETQVDLGEYQPGRPAYSYANYVALINSPDVGQGG